MDIKVTIWKTAPRGDKNQKSSVAGAANARSSMQLTHSKCLILITRSDNLHQGFIQMTSPVFLIMIPVRFHQTSQLAAMTQNLDGASGGWRDLDQNKAEQNSTKRGSYFDAQPSSLTQEVFINLSESLPGQWIFLADNIPADIIYLQKTDDADVMSWVASSVTACHNIWPRKCIMHIEELKLMSFLICPPLHYVCGDIYTALYFAGTGDSECTMAMHPGLRGDANLGMFNYAIV